MVDGTCQAGKIAYDRVRKFGVLLFACLAALAVILAAGWLIEAKALEYDKHLDALRRKSVAVHDAAERLHSVEGSDLTESRRLKLKTAVGELHRLRLAGWPDHVAVTRAAEEYESAALSPMDESWRSRVNARLAVLGREATEAQQSNDLTRNVVRQRLAVLVALVLTVLGVAAWYGNLRPLRKILQDWMDDQQKLVEANDRLAHQAELIEGKTGQLQTMVDDMEVQMALHGHASRRFQSLFDGLPVGCLTFDMEATVFEMNPQMGEVLGAPPHMFLLQNVCSVFSRESEKADAFMGVITDLRDNGRPIEIEWEYLRANDKRSLYLHVLPLRNQEGMVVGGICCALDITERKATEEAIERSEAQIRTLIDHAPTAIALVDTERRLLVATTAWLDSNGIEEVDYAGKDVFDLVREGDTHWDEAISDGFAGHPTVRDEEIFIRHDGRIQWMTWSVLPWKRADGTVGGIVMFQEDVTERRTIEQRVRDSEERFDMAVNAASVGIWDWNLGTNQMYWSPRFLDILGLGRDLDIHPHTEFVQRVHPDDEDSFAQQLNAHLKHRTPFSWEGRFRHVGGDYLWLHVRGQAVWSGVGRAARMVGAVDDISVRKAYELRVAESEKRFRDVVDASGEYIWEVDANMRYTYLSERFESVTGVPAAAAIGKKLTNFVQPSERTRLTTLFKDMRERGSRFANVTVETHSVSGAKVFQRLNGIPVLDPEGKCVGFRGAGLDISFQRAAEDALYSAGEKVRGILESIQDCFVSLNHDLEFTFVNHAAEEVFQQPGFVLNGSPLWDALPPEVHDQIRVELSLVEQGEAAHVFEFFVEQSDRWFEYRVSLGKDGYSIFFHDISDAKETQRLIEEQMLLINDANAQLEMQQMELQDANERLAHMADTDGLTQINNRKKLNEVLASTLRQAAETGGEVGLVIMDVDFFKKYNDSFGHVAGDDVLKTVARAVKESAGAAGIAARYGGEEFMVVVPEGGLEMALYLAEQIRAAIENQPWELRPVTASFGVALSAPGDTPEQVIERADGALYVSKQSGRNRVTCAGGNAEAA